MHSVAVSFPCALGVHTAKFGPSQDLSAALMDPFVRSYKSDGISLIDAWSGPTRCPSNPVWNAMMEGEDSPQGDRRHVSGKKNGKTILAEFESAISSEACGNSRKLAR